MYYLLAVFIIIVINVIPAFMPPTWIVVSYFYVRYELNLFGLVFISTLSSSFGRYLLTLSSEFISKKSLSRKAMQNVVYLGDIFKRHPKWIFTVTLAWSFAPIPSNPLFIALGLAHVNMKSAIVAFFIGRFINYSILAYTSQIVYQNLSESFSSTFLDWKQLLIAFSGVILILFYVIIDWQELIIKKKLKFIFNNNSGN